MEDLNEWQTGLSKLGIYTPDSLAKQVKALERQTYLVESLIPPQTLNLLVGDSNLGKTPLGIQLGISVAAGLPFLGRGCSQGRVLYCDAESDPAGFHQTLQNIRTFLGVSDQGSEFLAWSPHWQSKEDSGESGYSTDGDKLINRVRYVKPKLVIVDPLRIFWPQAETGSDDATSVIKSLRKVSKETGCAWLITHHRRKANQNVAAPRLDEDPRAWFQEAAGAHALVNHSDSRIGVVTPRSGQSDLLLGGFMRMNGPFVPWDLARALDEDGEPVGYKLLTGVEHLSDDQLEVYRQLPIRFRFKEMSALMGGTSASNASNFIKRCVSLRLVVKDGREYIKTEATVEDVERVECVGNAPSTPSTPSSDGGVIH